MSWVGLRGAVPIIFATYPVVVDVPGASQIFNIVFFVTLLSLVVQGTTVIAAARKLKLEEAPQPNENDFGIELAEENGTSLHTRARRGRPCRRLHAARHHASARQPRDDDTPRRAP